MTGEDNAARGLLSNITPVWCKTIGIEWVEVSRQALQLDHMFTIENEFDATVITLIDEAAEHRQEDITINAFEDCVTIEQMNPRDEGIEQITLSMEQIADLAAALDLPEGVYSRVRQRK